MQKNKQIDLTKKEKPLKYTQEQEVILKEDYEAAETDDERDEVVERYMDEWGKTKRSITAKLVSMKIFKNRAKISKITGEKPITKEAMVEEFERNCKQQKGSFAGMEKLPKPLLAKLCGLVPKL